MPSAIDHLAVYLHLANAAWKRLQMPDRDRLLMISASIACSMKMVRFAQYCRFLILENNPGHMIGKWPTVRDALGHADFQHFVRQVHRRFPIEKAETMLNELGIDRANERATYYSDQEYAAALLGVNLQWLEAEFGDLKE